MAPTRWLAPVGLVLSLLLTTDVAAATTRCEPLRARDWQEQCSTREGRERIEDLLDDVRRWSSLSDCESSGRACEILRIGDDASECERARRQGLAFALNRASGRVDGECCITIEGRRVRLEDLRRRHDDACHQGRNCEEARDFFSAANNASLVSACGPRDDSGGGTGHGDHGDGDCCRPRSKGFWHRQCMGPHPAYSPEEIRRIFERADRRIGGSDTGACDALDERNYSTPRGRAMAQYTALVLNYESGRLRGCDGDRDLRAAQTLIERADWEQAKNHCEAVNLGRSVRRCEGDSDDDDDRGRGEAHDDDHHDGKHADSPGQGKSQGQGHGKAKGKGKK